MAVDLTLKKLRQRRERLKSSLTFQLMFKIMVLTTGMTLLISTITFAQQLDGSRARAFENHYLAAQAAFAKLARSIRLESEHRSLWVPKETEPHRVQSAYGIPRLPQTREIFLALQKADGTERPLIVAYGVGVDGAYWRSFFRFPAALCQGIESQCIVTTSFGQGLFAGNGASLAGLVDSPAVRSFLNSGMKQGLQLVVENSFLQPQQIVAFQEAPGTNVIFFLVSPAFYLWASAIQNAAIALSLGLLVVLASMLFAWLTALQFVEPLRRLAQGLVMLERGNFAPQLPEEPSNEFSEIRKFLLRTGAGLAARESSLSRFHDELESLLSSSILLAKSESETDCIVAILMRAADHVLGEQGFTAQVNNIYVAEKKITRSVVSNPAKANLGVSSGEPEPVGWNSAYEAVSSQTTFFRILGAGKEMRIMLVDSGVPLAEVIWSAAYGFKIDAQGQQYLHALFQTATQVVTILRQRKEIVAKTKMEAELDAAKKIQKFSLPSIGNFIVCGNRRVASLEDCSASVLAQTRINVTAHYVPAERVSGDWYAVHHSSQLNTIFGAICDATGHGVPAAMLTAMVAGSFDTTLSLLAQSSKEATLLALHEAIAGTVRRVHLAGTLLSAILFALDCETHELLFINRGHPKPLVVNRVTGKVRALTACHSLLGDAPDDSIVDNQIQPHVEQLRAGDQIILYTDGLLENRALEVKLNSKILAETLLRNKDTQALSAQDLAQQIAARAQATHAADDVTLVSIEIQPQESRQIRNKDSA